MAMTADGRPTLLVLRALGLGDLLTAVPAYRALARAFPHHRRLLAAPPTLSPLLSAIGCFDGLLPSRPLQSLVGRIAPPDVAVNLHGAGPQSHHLLLACRPRRLVAFAHARVPETAALPGWRAGEHETRRWCRLLDDVGIAADPTDLDLAPPRRAAPPVAVGATVVHPGAASEARRWPAERWSAVIRAEHAAGRRVVLTGGPHEVALVNRIARAAEVPAYRVLAGRTDVTALAAVVAAADRVVCGDTGVAHLATAFGTPSVVLFGPTPPAEWGPPADRPWHRALWHGGAGDPHATTPDAGLLAIGLREVVDALATLPRNPGREAAVGRA
jgi:ADP-heptose:LPS heptosyltransferase